MLSASNNTKEKNRPEDGRQSDHPGWEAGGSSDFIIE